MEPRAVIDRFLAGRRLAVVGVSRDPRDFSRALFAEMIAKGYDLVPVHPAGGEVDGREVYARIQDVPGALDGAIVMTPAAASAQVVRDCHEAGVPRVWLHRGAGAGAVSREAVAYCHAHGIEVVPGECPLMFVGGSVHDVHRSLREATGHLPLGDAGRRAAARTTRVLHAVLVALELFVAIGAFYGGASMLADPAGSPVGLPAPGAMPGLRFASYLVPGVVLLLANGLLPLAVALGSLTGRRWAIGGHMLAGMMLTGWIAVQVLMLGWISFLQPLMLAFGIAIFAAGWLFHARKQGERRSLAVVG